MLTGIQPSKNIEFMIENKKKDKKLYGTPKGEPWIWLTTELLLSEA